MVKGPKPSHVTSCRFSPHQRPVEKLRKKSQNLHENKTSEKEELMKLYQQLSNIIPSCRNKCTSSVDIVVSAVDYIRELHSLLENTNVESSHEFRFSKLNVAFSS
uniref:Uncharacterized LOC100176581 n=1 Tax=Ciona intestinalis TaxID=7719 RepID=H2XKU9_CIOIN|nr:uncharacterized protein LOC100176581 [Ciona intestinalis]|eukprot:XP_002131485.1 uncharacterized protein LOC100176581 [Ciona intestinalis]